MLDKAQELDSQISDEEARKKAQEVKQLLDSELNDIHIPEIRLSIEKDMQELGMTEADYWSEHVIPAFKELLAIEQLQKLAREETSDWPKFMRETVDEFEEKYKKEIEAFKKEVQK